LPVNDAVDHLRADVDTKQANYENSESVSDDSQGNYKRDQKDAAPGSAGRWLPRTLAGSML
jgi:hypothetical protein